MCASNEHNLCVCRAKRTYLQETCWFISLSRPTFPSLNYFRLWNVLEFNLVRFISTFCSFSVWNELFDGPRDVGGVVVVGAASGADEVHVDVKRRSHSSRDQRVQDPRRLHRQHLGSSESNSLSFVHCLHNVLTLSTKWQLFSIHSLRKLQQCGIVFIEWQK